MTNRLAGDANEKVIDLTHTMYHDMPTFPGDPGFSLEPYHSVARDGYNTTKVIMPTHVGTHLDAPLHFIEGGKTTDTMDLTRCVGQAHLLDFSHKGADEEITVDDFAGYDDVIQKGARLIIRTGWDEVYPEDRFFTEMPGIHIDAAKHLAERGIALIGMDMPSVHSRDYVAVHQILLKAEIVIVEWLANLQAIKQTPFYFVALPLKFKGRDGSPVRAIAIES